MNKIKKDVLNILTAIIVIVCEYRLSTHVISANPIDFVMNIAISLYIIYESNRLIVRGFDMMRNMNTMLSVPRLGISLSSVILLGHLIYLLGGLIVPINQSLFIAIVRMTTGVTITLYTLNIIAYLVSIIAIIKMKERD